MLFKEFFYLPKSDRSVLIVVLIAIVGIILLIFGIRDNECNAIADVKDSLGMQKRAISSRNFYPND